jgi:hypothetical protein
MMTKSPPIHELCVFSSSIPATIKSQFIEISHDLVRVGDDVTLRCLHVDDEQDSEDVTNYVWYLNSECPEKHFLLIFLFLPPALPQNPPRFVSFFLLHFFSSCFPFRIFSNSSANFRDAKQIKKSSTTSILHYATMSC